MNTDRRAWYALALLAGAQFMDVLDFSIVQVALPTIRADLDMSAAAASWVVSIYALTYAGFLLLWGRATDVLGRRRLFRGGLATFTAASAVGAVAQTGELLIAARAAQGFGAAMLTPAALALIMGLFREPGRRAKALGILGATGSSGVAAGLLLGGVLTAGFGWRAVFVINIPLGLAALVLSTRLLDPDDVRSKERLDVPGAVTATLASLLVVAALTGAESAGLTSARTLGMLAAGLGVLGAFVVIEQRSAAPLVPLSMFRSPQLRTGNAVAFLASAAFAAQFLLVSLYLQQVADFDALSTGLAFLPMAALLAVASGEFSPMSIQRFGLRTTTVLGTSVMTVGMLLFALTASASPAYFTTVLPPLVLVAAGQGLAWTAFYLSATTDVSSERQGTAGGLVIAAQQLGAGFGIAVLVTVLSTAGSAETGAGAVSGFRMAFLAGAVIAAGATVVAAAGRRPGTDSVADEATALVAAES